MLRNSRLNDKDEEEDDPFWRYELPEVAIRAPSMADTCSAKYTAIKPDLETFLSRRYSSYLFAPVIVTPREGSDIPALVVLLDEQNKDEFPTPLEFAQITGNEFVLGLGRGDVESSVSSKRGCSAGFTYMISLGICGKSSAKFRQVDLTSPSQEPTNWIRREGS